MFEVFILSNILVPAVLAYQNPNNPSQFYTSGIGDKVDHQIYYNNTAFAVLSIPFKFKSNNYNPELDAGFYQLEPVIVDDKPTCINMRQLGEIKAVVSVIDYKLLNYDRKEAVATVTLIENGTKAEINLKYSKFDISAIIEVYNITPE